MVLYDCSARVSSFLREFDSAACQGGVCRLMGATCSLVRTLIGARAARREWLLTENKRQRFLSQQRHELAVRDELRRVGARCAHAGTNRRSMCEESPPLVVFFSASAMRTAA